MKELTIYIDGVKHTGGSVRVAVTDSDEEERLIDISNISPLSFNKELKENNLMITVQNLTVNHLTQNHLCKELRIELEG